MKESTVFAAIASVSVAAYLIAVAVSACSPPRAPIGDAVDGTGRGCAAAILVDDDVAAQACRACRARGEVAP